jgi:hypothetical protein
MERGQSTVEYVLLVTMLVLGMCLLVRFPTPVAWMARAVAHAVAHRPAAPRRHGGGHHHGSPHRHPHPCLCPGERAR